MKAQSYIYFSRIPNISIKKFSLLFVNNGTKVVEDSKTFHTFAKAKQLLK